MRKGWAGIGIFLAGILGIGATAPPIVSKTEIKILSAAELPVPAYLRASDVRWAGERRVYLGLGTDGTVEVSLDPAGSEPKERIPGRDKPGGQWAARYVAASSQYLVAAGPAFALSWRRLDRAELSTFAFDSIQAIDVRENRLLVVGTRRDEKGKFAPDGAIAWIGSLDQQLADLKPFLYDAAGPGAPTMNRCLASSLSAARFLADGSFVVLPGVQAGFHLYDPQGKLLRTWDTASLGIDTDCASLSAEQVARFATHGLERQAWANQRRTVDAILPLASGIGFVVRRVEQDRARWDLKVLRRDGSIQSYKIPVEGSNGSFHLLGDVRGGRMIFLLQEVFFSGGGGGRDHPFPSRLILAEAPPG